MPPRICTGCGKGEFAVTRLHCDLCSVCCDTLQQELDRCKEEHKGPRFLAVYFRGATTLGCGLYISQTPEQAMAEARRLADRNGWLLLRVDIQSTLQDIYVHPDYNKYFPGSHKKALEFKAA